MNAPGTDLAVDEDVWASFDYWMYTDIEYLILDIDPEKLVDRQDVSFTDRQEDERRRVRRILDQLRYRTADRQSIDLLTAIKHLRRVGHELPERLVAAVKNSRDASYNFNGALSSKPQHQTALSKEVVTLRKVLLAIAVDRFWYHPQQRGSEVREWADCVAARGLSVHTDTIRNHLQAAYQELDQEERRALRDGKV